MKDVIILGASGNLAKLVIDILLKKDDINLTLFLRNSSRLKNKDLTKCRVIEGDVMDYSKLKEAIILSPLDSILKYAQRFYKRQFIDRKPLTGMTVTKFNESLSAYFEKGAAGETGLPTVNHMASQLHLSPKYLSDLLKQETGKTALELIHLYVISETKNMLVAGDRSISEIAYQLGFENPPYFSRLFKKEVGMSPKEYKNHSLN
jgi:AraC family transcriptional activator of pobA